MNVSSNRVDWTNASDYRTNGLSGKRTIELTDERTGVRIRVEGPIYPVSPIVRCIIKCDPDRQSNTYHTSLCTVSINTST